MKTIIKIIIAGSRNFSNYELLKNSMDRIISKIQKQDKNKDYEIEIIEGEALGADALGRQYGFEKGYKIKAFPADWYDLSANPCVIRKNKRGIEYNVLAGFNRNKDMAEYAKDAEKSILVAFWDGKSKGTKNMIDIAKKNGLEINIIKEGEE